MTTTTRKPETAAQKRESDALREAVHRAVRRKLRGVDVEQKDAARTLNEPAVRESRRVGRASLARYEEDLLSHFASGHEVRPVEIAPRLIEVTTDEQARLFRYAALHWSIPVSMGYGRRLRFLVEDAKNDKLIGLIGLGDPVFSLSDRDAWVGWTFEQRERRLRSVMDAFVLGAVPPYSQMLGGKLVSTLALSQEIQDAFWRKYGWRTALISGRQQRHRLAMLTTTSAFGRSSQYNRLRLAGKELWTRVGATRGHGEFLFSGKLYERLHAYVKARSTAGARAENWGDIAHWRNRREVVRKALGLLGLPYTLHVHGLERDIYVAPLATNTKDWFIGRDRTLTFEPQTSEQLASAAIERWVLPRAATRPEWKMFDRETLRLWGTRERQQHVR